MALLDLLAPQKSILEFHAASTGWLRSVYQEIIDRQEQYKRELLQGMQTHFGINRQTALCTPLGALAPRDQTDLYRYLEQSSLKNVLREMIEANALWHITQRKADIIIVMAGTNHTGHNDGNFIYKTPGLTRFLTRLGYTTISTQQPLHSDLLTNKEAIARQLSSYIPALIAQQIAQFTDEQQ
jgi:hypothetical protein